MVLVISGVAGWPRVNGPEQRDPSEVGVDDSAPFENEVGDLTVHLIGRRITPGGDEEFPFHTQQTAITTENAFSAVMGASPVVVIHGEPYFNQSGTQGWVQVVPYSGSSSTLDPSAGDTTLTPGFVSAIQMAIDETTFPPALVLDVGCGLGTMTLALGAAGTQVLAVDPSPDIRTLITASMVGSESGIGSKVTLISTAAGMDFAVARLLLPDLEEGATPVDAASTTRWDSHPVRVGKRPGRTRVEEVPVSPLSSWVHVEEGEVALMMLDTGGDELAALVGAAPIMSSNGIPHIFLVFNPLMIAAHRCDPVDVLEFVHRAGYVVDVASPAFDVPGLTGEKWWGGSTTLSTDEGRLELTRWTHYVASRGSIMIPLVKQGDKLPKDVVDALVRDFGPKVKSNTPVTLPLAKQSVVLTILVFSVWIGSMGFVYWLGSLEPSLEDKPEPSPAASLGSAASPGSIGSHSSGPVMSRRSSFRTHGVRGKKRGNRSSRSEKSPTPTPRSPEHTTGGNSDDSGEELRSLVRAGSSRTFARRRAVLRGEKDHTIL